MLQFYVCSYFITYLTILYAVYMFIFLLQDKKYYPTAEEVYGPEVEVGTPVD